VYEAAERPYVVSPSNVKPNSKPNSKETVGEVRIAANNNPPKSYANASQTPNSRTPNLTLNTLAVLGLTTYGRYAA
jgi:hypothetical protein